MEGVHPLSGKALLNQKNKIVSADEALRNIRIIVLYFTGSWCQQHRHVTEILKDIHEEGIRREFGLEVINVPCETINLKDMVEHFNEQGNWYSVIYGDIVAQELRWMFNINYIPNIIAISKNGNILSKNGLQEVLNEKLNVLVKWDI